MQDLLELGTGQVAFFTGLLAGFSLTAAVHLLRQGLKGFFAHLTFYLFVITTLLLFVALYTDVRLTIELAGLKDVPPEAEALVSKIRTVGTSCATAGFFCFVVSIGLMGWVARPFMGVLTTVAAVAAMSVLVYIWRSVFALQAML